MSLLQEVRELPARPSDLRKFSALLGSIFLLLGAYLRYRGVGYLPEVSWGVAAYLLAGLVAPPLVRPFYYAWMTLALALGFVVTRLLLTLFFFLVLTPVGLFFKLTGRDALRRKADPEATTYWIDKEYPIRDRSRYEKFF